ncbi:MAG: hypothetical protein VB021_07725 [Oscillospiraceae bacterium]|nr:hypothetical protein [Oscillospiraceae bacterium]
MRFIKTPNLPSGAVCFALVSARAKDVIAALERRGIEVLPVGDAPNLPQPIASHADVNCLHLGGGAVAVNSEQTSLCEALRRRGFEVIPQRGMGKRYPDDCALNALLIGQGTSLSHAAALSGPVGDFLFQRHFSFLRVKQGYARCSAALLNAQAAMTADRNIREALAGIGCECLLLPAGEIALPGYAGGFIGGCCFKLDGRTLAFAGRAAGLSYYAQIAAFCGKWNTDICELGSGPLTDIGGAVPLLEE